MELLEARKMEKQRTNGGAPFSARRKLQAL
jgi:hypothetical protein